jgi:protein gp37
MSKTTIEWTQETWNPIVGCSIVSPGCTNCYAMQMAARIEAMGNQPRYAGTTRKVNGNVVWTGKLALAPEATLLAPLKRKKPTTYFVNSMGDLFHEDCPNEWIDRVFAVMALCPQHTFQVLTKRAGRMREYCRNARVRAPGFVEHACGIAQKIPGLDTSSMRYLDIVYKVGADYPLPNVWLGVSTERQQEADERIPLLLQTPAAVRFVSAEPLLGPIDLTRVRAPEDPHTPQDQEWLFDSLSTGAYYEQRFRNSFDEVWYDSGDGPYRETKLDWVIAGGESGPNARPMHPDWARSLRDQCAAAGVAYFFKQWGAWLPGEANHGQFDPTPMNAYRRCDNHSYEWPQNGEVQNFGTHPDRFSGDFHARKVGKAVAGRLLDGVQHNAMPTVRL